MRQSAGIRTFYSSLFVLLIWFYATPLLAQPAGLPPVGPDIREGPRFVVTAISFRAVDETGWDRWGADEVVVVFRTPTYALVGKEYGDVDSDDSATEFQFQQTCIAPAIDPIQYSFRWTCRDTGVSGPITFTVGFYEQDIDFVGFLCIFGGCGFSYPQSLDGDVFKPGSDFPQEKSPNDRIGKEKVQISLETLLQKLPRVGDSYRDKVSLYGGCDNSTTTTPCTSGDTTEYEMIYEVRRAPDVAFPVNPVTAAPPSPPGG
jgi:hypothetical protein